MGGWRGWQQRPLRIPLRKHIQRTRRFRCADELPIHQLPRLHIPEPGQHGDMERHRRLRRGACIQRRRTHLRRGTCIQTMGQKVGCAHCPRYLLLHRHLRRDRGSRPRQLATIHRKGGGIRSLVRERGGQHTGRAILHRRRPNVASPFPRGKSEAGECGRQGLFQGE